MLCWSLELQAFVGIGSFVKTDLKWSSRAFALSGSIVFKLLFTFSVGMPRCCFVLSDEGPKFFGFDVKLSPMMLLM